MREQQGFLASTHEGEHKMRQILAELYISVWVVFYNDAITNSGHLHHLKHTPEILDVLFLYVCNAINAHLYKAPLHFFVKHQNNECNESHLAWRKGG